MREKLPSVALSYAVALAAALAAVAVRALLDPLLGNSLPLVTLFAAVAAAVWFGGYLPALASALVGYLGCHYFFIEPRGTLYFSARDVVGAVAYLASCALIIGFGEALRRARRDARLQRDRLQVTLGSIGDAVITTDTEGRVVDLNRVAEAVTGWTHSEAVGQPLDAVFHALDEGTRAPVENPARRAVREGGVVRLVDPTLLIAKDGSERPIEDSAAPILAPDGATAGSVLVFRDTAERRAAEKLLQSNERELSDFFENASIGLHSIGSDGTILRVNRAELELLGYAREEYVGRNITEFHADREAIDEILACLMRGETLRDRPARLRCKDGSLRDVLLDSNACFEDGRVVYTRCFTRDVTAQKRAETALKEEDHRKDVFLATLAHELRNPLAPLRSSLEILKRAGADATQVEPALDTMSRQLSHLHRLVDDLLDLSRITHNRLELRPRSVELATVLQHALEASRPLAEASRHEVVVELPDTPIHLFGDPIRLAQVFGNLLNNAFKYTEPGGRIELGVERLAGEVAVSVRDNGIGIDPGRMPHIFEMFARADRDPERAQGGLGIGLTLVKQLVEMHGGRIEVESAGHGSGSVFRVRLPILEEAAEERTSEPAALPPAPPRRILVVDDNKDAAESLAMLLGLEGNDIQLAFDGIQAVEAVEQHEPDIVLLDIGLPRLNGFEACRRMRQRSAGQRCLIVALTGWGHDEDRRATREAGFDGHLVKPVDYEALMRLLATLEHERQGGPTRDGSAGAT
jgi:PAS domain S-box-containing protein